jgi:ribonucleoside-diphosphate reductase alpha chain
MQEKIITLEVTHGVDDAVAQWAADNKTVVSSFKVIRHIGEMATLSISEGEKPQTVMPERAQADYSRDNLLQPFGIATLQDRYLLDHEKSPQDAFLRAARAFADNEAHAQRIYDYASKLWFMFSTPVLSNAPVRESWGKSFSENFVADRYEGKIRGLPISCFLAFTPDSRKGLTDHYTELAWLSSVGGGVGGFWGAIRSDGTATSKGSMSSGQIPFLKVVDSEVRAFAQGRTRRASYAAYNDISHPEIVEFLEMRTPTGGDENRKCLNLHIAVNIPDAFMEKVEALMVDPNASDEWPLVDPHTGDVKDIVSVKALWRRILELRVRTGEPYIHFIDASNRAMPQSQKDKGLYIHQSNLCSEITLATSEDRTAVCCLSSPNLEYFDEWKHVPEFIPDIIRFLDNVLEFFIRNAPPELSKAVYSAQMERSLGMGAMGFHSYLQKNGILFESALAVSANRRMFSLIKKQAVAATQQLARERGACPDANGHLIRNMHLMAVAPNASSSIICGGTSASVEPYNRNAYTHKTDSGSWQVRNPYLAKTLEKAGRNDEDTWRDILLNKGSVQHLEFLSEHEKQLFRTADELNQFWLVEHAATRQEYICQAQSINLFFAADASVAYLHQVHYRAWKAGLKSLYYLRSTAIKRAEGALEAAEATRRSDPVLSKDELINDAVCLACEG